MSFSQHRIKRFRFRPFHQQLSFWSKVNERQAVVARLLKAPWLWRGSDLESDVGGEQAHLLERPVPVRRRSRRRTGEECVLEFRDGRRWHRITHVLASWRIDRFWWDERQHVKRAYYRVLTNRGGPYELCYDALRRRWLLAAVFD